MDGQYRQVCESIKNGGIGVIPTDTLYGIVASAFDADAVEQIYELKLREPEKPFIILINNIADLEQFGVVMSAELIQKLQEYWPGPTSVILHCPDEQFSYLHRDKYTLAFRLPKDETLRTLLSDTGPLVAPSANTTGEEPAHTIQEARRYFGSEVDFYVDAGVRAGSPSTLIDLSTDTPRVLRGSNEPQKE